MLLASSITPSGAVWAESAARKAISTAHVVDLGDFSDHPLVAEFSESFCVTGASRVSGDLSGAMASVRRTAMLLAAFDSANSRVDPTVVVVDGSVPELVSDACSFSALLQVSAAETPLAQRAKTMSDALAGGDVEWIVVTPPERAAMDSVTVQVAQGCALGLRVTGVVVAPMMPRKRDGWPNKIRRSARGLVEQLQDRLFDIPVQRSRAGKVPVLPSRAARGIEPRGAKAAVSHDLAGICVFIRIRIRRWARPVGHYPWLAVLRCRGRSVVTRSVVPVDSHRCSSRRCERSHRTRLDAASMSRWRQSWQETASRCPSAPTRRSGPNPVRRAARAIRPMSSPVSRPMRKSMRGIGKRDGRQRRASLVVVPQR